MKRTSALQKWSWALPVLFIILCVSLGVLQYRWIDEASRAERDRLRAGLQDSITRLAIAVNSDITSAVSAFFPAGRPPEEPLQPEKLSELYLQWRESTHHDDLFASIGLAVLNGRRLELFQIDPASGAARPSVWPPHWRAIRERLEMRAAQLLGLPPDPRTREFRPGPPPPEEAMLFEVARFGRAAVDPRAASISVTCIRRIPDSRVSRSAPDCSAA